MPDLLETAELEAFARIVEAGSLSKAAIELEVPRATIGRRLGRLEERLGVRLLRRSTRKLALTDAGTTLYHHARNALTAVREAAESVRDVDGVIRGRLRISVPPMMKASFDALINGFLARHPEVQLHVHASPQRVDLIAGGFDLALRAGGILDPGLIARPLARSRLVAIASPDYLARRGTPRRARDLRNHACLLGFDRGEVPSHYWPLRSGGAVRVDGPFASNEPTAQLSAAVAGLGITLLPLFLVAHELGSGAIEVVLPDIIDGAVQVAVVYPERELVPPLVRAFVDELTAWGRQEFVGVGKIEAQCPDHPPRAAKTRRRRAAAR